MFNSVLFSIFREVCTHHNCLIPKLFFIPEMQAVFVSVTPLSQPLEAADLLSVSVALPGRFIQKKAGTDPWRPFCFQLLSVDERVFKVHPCCSLCQLYSLWLNKIPLSTQGNVIPFPS